MKIYERLNDEDFQDVVKHPSLPLYMAKGLVYDPTGDIVSHCDQGDHFYVFFYRSNLVLSTNQRFQTTCTNEILKLINDKYLYAFQILCAEGVTAVIDWVDEVVLVGITAGYLHNGDLIWTPASKITWPGQIKE